MLQKCYSNYWKTDLSLTHMKEHIKGAGLREKIGSLFFF